jgi:hypothetical protein
MLTVILVLYKYRGIEFDTVAPMLGDVASSYPQMPLGLGQASPCLERSHSSPTKLALTGPMGPV